MESIFTYLQKVNGLYSVPIIGIFLLGIFTKHVPAIAAKVGMVIGIIVYSYFSFINIQDVPIFLEDNTGSLHWIHGYFISFLFSIFTMLFIGYLYPKSRQEINISDRKELAPINMDSWKHARKASFGIIIITLAIYLVLTLLSN